MTSFAEFDSYVRAREREYIDELKNIAIVDYVDHIRAFGRFLHTFAGRAVA